MKKNRHNSESSFELHRKEISPPPPIQAIVSEDNFVQEIQSSLLKLINEHCPSPLKEIVTYHFANPGKMIRPKIIYNLAKYLDCPPEKAFSWALCCELLHNATLIHDDLQDGDLYRRKQKTVWHLYGKNQAINAGDFLLTFAPRVLLEAQLSPHERINLSLLYSKISSQVAAGQSEEFLLKDALDSNKLEEKYFNCVLRKTASLFSGLSRGVACVAGLNAQATEELSEIFLSLGIIFQWQDDILDLFGDKNRDCAGNDVKEGKISFLLVSHIKKHPEDLNCIKKLILKSRNLTTQQDIDILTKLLREKGTLQSTLKKTMEQASLLKKSPFLSKTPLLQPYIDQIIREVFTPLANIMKDPSLK